VDIARRALQLDRDNPEVADTLGWALLQFDGDVDEAVRLLERAVSGLPDNPTVRYHLAVGHERAGDSAQSLIEVRAALAGEAFPERSAAEELARQIESRAADEAS
jgi:Flp pilus assembly protein TadD